MTRRKKVRKVEPAEKPVNLPYDDAEKALADLLKVKPEEKGEREDQTKE